MRKMESYETFILGAYGALLVDCASYYPGLTKEFRRDFSRLSSAVEQLGIGFALDSLPAFGKHFDVCLSEQHLTLSHLPHMRAFKKGVVIPRLFRGLLLRVFDEVGHIRCDPDVEAIRLLRQLYRLAQKFVLPSNRQNTAKAAIDFFQIDDGVDDGHLNWGDHNHFDPRLAAELSYTDRPMAQIRVDGAVSGTTLSSIELINVLANVQRAADLFSAHLGSFCPLDWRPKHGPGAVSDNVFGSYKYDFKHWSDRLEAVFPYADFAVANYACVDTDSPVCSDEQFSKLIAVPKTLTTPRLIASEPTSHQWCQQIIKDYFYRRTAVTPLGRIIDFCDQTKNGDLAKRASQSGSHSTIDLSSASDRVSCWHVERLFRRLPCLLAALQSCRTTKIKQSLCRDFPMENTIRKYSTMGNATIFPVQSILFASIAIGSLCYIRNLPVNERTLRNLGSKQVRVFGDDIIVPEDCSGVVVDILQYLGLKVNVHKTFQRGFFRESCGVDAYKGVDVTPVRILRYPVRTGPGSIVSAVDTHHNVCDAGFVALATYVYRTAARVVSNKIPFVKHGSGLFGWSDLFGSTTTNVEQRYCHRTFQIQYRCYQPKVDVHRVPPDNSAGLLQFFIEAAVKVTSRDSSIGYLLRRPKTGLSLRWVPLG